MRVIRHAPVLDWGLLMPFLVGTTFGYLYGYIYNQRKQRHLSLKNAVEQQRLLNQILVFSSQETSLQKVLEYVLKVIINSPFGKLQAKGGIFLSDGSNNLVLKSHLGLGPELLNACGKNGIQFGECLCGLAALKKETIYKSCVDNNHTITFSSMKDHGHYNVPILHQDKVLGVIVVYLDVGHPKNPVEIEFLEATTKVLAIIINKYNVDIKAKENEFKLKEIQDFAGIGTWQLSIATGQIVASDEVFEIMGYKPQQFQYNEEEFLNVTHKNDKKLVIESLTKAKQGIPFEIEARHFKKDGSIAHIVNKCSPKIETDGSIKFLNGTIIDLTNIRSKEQELREKQALVNGILKGTPDPLFLMDLDKNEITYYNKAMEEVFILNPDFILNYPQKGAAIFRDYVHPDDLQYYDEMNRQLRAGKDTFQLQFRTNIFSGNYNWVDQIAMVYSRNKKGRVKQVLVVSKDVTDRVTAENSVKKLNKELTIKLSDIKKVNAELDQFVYSVSHDLRAPLASVLGLVNLCQNHPDENLMEECIDRIGISIKKLDGFIKDILDYSRNSRTEVKKEVFSIQELTKELIENIRLLSNPDIELILHADEKQPFVGDKRRMSIIINNILSNACKYADLNKPKRWVKIDISTTEKEAVFHVEDNGIGVEEGQLEKVFGMFYRGTIYSEGSGLGLYIVKETLNKMEGKIELSSTIGEGTTIEFTVPQGNLPVSSSKQKRHKKIPKPG